jgi:hypothetical protein
LALTTGFSVSTLTGVLWLNSKATTISAELESATGLIPQLQDALLSKDVARATMTVDSLKMHTATARGAASDPLWTLAGALPWIGANFQAATEVSRSADDVVRLGAAPLVSVFQSLEWKNLLPDQDGVDLGVLAKAQPKISSAAHAVRQSSERLNGIDADKLLPQISAPLNVAREQLDSLRGGLDAAADAATITPKMLGADAPRRYLLLIQNNAEVRASGGIPGAVSILSVDNGKLTLGSQTSAGALGAFLPPIKADPEQELIYSTRLGTYMQDVNLTPDFPTTAGLAKAMWKKKTGENVDGVISLDPVALGYILDATGPVQLDDPQVVQLARDGLPLQLTGKNIVPTLLSDVYSRISEPALQDAYFAGVAKEAFVAFSSGKSDPTTLLEGLSRGVSERRVLLWSGETSEQLLISGYPVSGAISGHSIAPAQFGVYFNDGTGAKMDYYVKRTVQLIEECTRDEYSQIKVRVTSTNTAPKDAARSLPAYVTGGGVFGVPAGTVQTNVTAYGPVQANVETAEQGGRKIPFSARRHSGRPVGTVTVSLAPGQSTTIDLTFSKIVQHSKPTLTVTPTIQPVKDVVLTAKLAECTPAKESAG